MKKKRDYSFFRLEFSSVVSLGCLFLVFAIAHLPSVFSTEFLRLSLHSWLLSLLALFIPVWNIIVAYREEIASRR
jgi:hypothetical protein